MHPMLVLLTRKNWNAIVFSDLFQVRKISKTNKIHERGFLPSREIKIRLNLVQIPNKKFSITMRHYTPVFSLCDSMRRGKKNIRGYIEVFRSK